MLNFKLDFERRLANALVQGGYETPAEFAQAVTKFYMTTIVKGTPAGIPPTLPVGYTPFNPAPIGPASPVPYRNREKIFYNTIKTYYTIKDLNNAKSFIAFATRDVQNAVQTATKLRQEIEEKVKRIAEIDEEFKQLKEDLKSIGPEVREYFNEKKETFLKLAKSVGELVDRLDDIPIGNAIEGGAAAFFKEEITLYNTFKSFKLDIGNIKDSVVMINTILKQATAKQKKYENDFSTQANIKVFFWKRVQAFLTEVAKIVGSIINPAESIGYLKELLYVPKAEKFARIMLRIINRNAQLKYQKDTLIRSINTIKSEIQDRVQKRIDGMSTAIQEKLEKIAGIQRKGGKKKTTRESIKRLKEELKIVAQDVKFAIKVVNYLTKLLNTVVTITTKITLLIDEFKDYWNTTIKQDILQKAKDGIQAIKDQINQSPEQGIDINLIFKQFRITNNVIKTALDKIMQSAKLTSPQILAKLKTPVDKFEQLLKAVEEIIRHDLPSLVHSINNPPRRDGSSPKQSTRRQNKTTKPKKARKVTAAMVTDKLLYAFNWLGELIERLRKDYVEKYKTAAINKLKELQKDVTNYIADITDFNPTAKKIQSKKREVDAKRVELEDEKIKAELIAKSAILFAKMVQAGLRLTNRLAPTDGSTRQLSITANERDLLDFYKYYSQWELLTKRKTDTQVADSTRNLKRKIKDFKVYEQIFEFFKEMDEEMKQKQEDGKTFKDFINEKLDGIRDRTVNYATSDLEDRVNQIKGFFTNTPKSLTDFVNLPLGLVDILDFNTDLFLGESRFLKKTRSKIQNLQDQIPADTQDSILLYFKEQLGKGVSVVGEMIKLFKRGVDKLIQFIKQNITDPAIKTVSAFIEEKKVKFRTQQQDRVRRRLDAEARRKLDAAAATFVFGLAGRLFWTGLTWKNPVDTTFTVLNIGPFTPLDPNEFFTSAGAAEQMSRGFEAQVQAMTGLCTPNPSLAIPPFPFQGYI